MDFRKRKNGPLPILSDSEKGMKVGIVCCSNGKQPEWKEQQGQLTRVFAQMGLEPVYSECIFAETSVFGGTARERAKSLMDFYKDPEIRAIYDISGGDIANEVLPYLDFKIIRDRKSLRSLNFPLSCLSLITASITGLPTPLMAVSP